MPGSSRRWRLVAVVALLMLLAASVSVHRRRTVAAVASSGRPLHPTYIAYGYEGSRFNPAHAASYRAGPLRVARSNADGRIIIPAALHVHRPFPIESHPRLRVEIVYVPGLHNASARVDKDGRAVVEDLTGDPERWQLSLWNVASMVSRLTSRTSEQPALRELDPGDAALIRELIGHFRQEYDGFLARYRDTPRRKPEMPNHVRMSSLREQQSWQETIDDHLAREPVYGMLVTRVFGGQVKVFSEWERELR